MNQRNILVVALASVTITYVSAINYASDFVFEKRQKGADGTLGYDFLHNFPLNSEFR